MYIAFSFSSHILSLCFLFDMSYNYSHLRTNSVNFVSVSEDKQAALVVSKQSKCYGGNARLFTLSESSRYLLSSRLLSRKLKIMI